MRAITYDRYGPPEVLQLAEVPEPALTGKDVLVRVKSASLNPKDSFTRKGRFRALSGGRFPKRCGVDLAGVVVHSGSPRFRRGDRVFGFLAELRYRRGTLAEMVVCRGWEIAPIPDAVTDEAAAATALVGLTALQAFRHQARLRSGARLLVNGASGGVGTAAIQIGRILGAEVHTVSSEANEPLCRELGAHSTWSYPDHAWKREPPFDVVFDVFGNLAFDEVRPHLTARGRYVSTVPTARRFVREVLTRFAAQQERLIVVRPRPADFVTLGEWLATGRLRAVIDSRYPLGQVRQAFERLESKRTRGKIVIEVA